MCLVFFMPGGDLEYFYIPWEITWILSFAVWLGLFGWACQLRFFYVFSPSFSFFLYWAVGLVWLRLSSEASLLCLWLGFSLLLFCSSSFGPFLCGWASPFIFLLPSSLLSSTARPFLFSWASPPFFFSLWLGCYKFGALHFETFGN